MGQVGRYVSSRHGHYRAVIWVGIGTIDGSM